MTSYQLPHLPLSHRIAFEYIFYRMIPIQVRAIVPILHILDALPNTLSMLEDKINVVGGNVRTAVAER